MEERDKPKGRTEMKQLLINSTYHASHRTIDKFYVKKKSTRDALDEGIEEMIQDKVDEISDIPTEVVTDDDFGMSHASEGHHLAPLPQGTIVEAEDEFTVEELDSYLHSPRNSAEFEAIEYLKKSIAKIGTPETLIAHQESLFKSYLYNNVDPFPMRTTFTCHQRFDWPLIRQNNG